MWVWDEAQIGDMSELLRMTCVETENLGPIRQNIPVKLLI